VAARTPDNDRTARHARLCHLGPDAVLVNDDARLYSGDPSPATWERLRAEGKLPPAIRLTGRLLGYRKRDLDARLDALTEPHPDDGIYAEVAQGPKNAGLEPVGRRTAKVKDKVSAKEEQVVAE
jgi:hypothetical protein